MVQRLLMIGTTVIELQCSLSKPQTIAYFFVSNEHCTNGLTYIALAKCSTGLGVLHPSRRSRGPV